MKNDFLRFFVIFLIVSFLLPGFVFAASDQKENSLSKIDKLIENLDYNAAIDSLASYMAENPDDFDRAQKRVMKILEARKNYNKKASSLVDLIETGSGKKTEKLEKIRELEKREGDATENYVEFTNLARRTVTLGELFVIYNKIMKEGVSFVHNEKYIDAAQKFEEGFELKNEKSDVVFEISDSAESEISNSSNLNSLDFDSKNDEEKERGILVVYESDITEPVQKAVENVKNLIAGGFKETEDDCEKTFRRFVQAAESGNLKETKICLF